MSGNNQTGVAGQMLASPLIVKVTNAGGNPVGGLPITFATIGGGTLTCGVTQIVVNTDAGGLAEWLGEDWKELRPQKPRPVVRKKKVLEHTPDIVEVYLRADKNLDRQTAEALSQLFRNAYENYMKSVRKG